MAVVGFNSCAIPHIFLSRYTLHFSNCEHLILLKSLICLFCSFFPTVCNSTQVKVEVLILHHIYINENGFNFNFKLVRSMPDIIMEYMRGEVVIFVPCFWANWTL